MVSASLTWPAHLIGEGSWGGNAPQISGSLGDLDLAMMKYQKVSTKKKGRAKRSASIPFDLHHIIQPSIDWKKIESGCHSYPVFSQEPTRIKHMIIQWSNTEALGMYAYLANHRCTAWHSESWHVRFGLFGFLMLGSEKDTILTELKGPGIQVVCMG